MPTSLETVIAVHAIETSAPATGCSVSGSLTSPMSAEPPKRCAVTVQRFRMIVAADGTAMMTPIALSGCDVKRLGHDLQVQRVQSRMEDSELKRARRQTVEPKPAQRVGLSGHLHAVDQDRSVGEKSAVQAVDYDAEDLRLAVFGPAAEPGVGLVWAVRGAHGTRHAVARSRSFLIIAPMEIFIAILLNGFAPCDRRGQSLNFRVT